MSAGDISAFAQGAVVTVTLSFVGILLGLPIGLGLALDPMGERAGRRLGRGALCQRAPRHAAGHAAAAVVLRPAQCRRAYRSLFGRHPGAGHEHIGLQLRDLAGGADEFSEGPVRGRPIGRHARRAALPAHRLPADRAHQPARSGQRDVASHQGDAGPGGGRAWSTSRAPPSASVPRPTNRCRRSWWRWRSMSPIVFALVSLQRWIERRQVAAEAAA